MTTRPRSGWLAVLVAVIVLVWFANLDARRLIRPDEGRYGEIAREMAATGDWVTPRLNGLKYFEKPPLQYWLTAAAFRVFGPDEWTARWWPATSGALCVLLVWFTGRRTLGRPAGDYAGLVCVSMLWTVANGHLNTLDMGLTFFLTGALCAFLIAEHPDTSRAARGWWVLLAWAACAGAVLSKGLVGLVLPGGAIAGYVLITRDWAMLRRIRLLPGLAILLVLCAPWFVAVSVANPEFPDFFFVREHFQRYLTPVHRRSEPWWFFLPLLVAGTLPWTLLAGRAVFDAARDERHSAEGRRRVLLLAWSAFVVLFFSASSSKLPSYILPVFPALAWLMGESLARIPPRRLFWHAVPLLPIAVAAFVLGLRADRYANDRTPVELYQAFEPWILGAASVMFVGAIIAAVAARRENRAVAAIAISLAGLGSWQLAITGHDALSPSFSSHRFTTQLKTPLRADCPLYSLRTYDQTLPFYLGRTTTLVAYADEMAFGLEREPHLGIPDMRDFIARWNSPACAYAFMEPVTFDEMTREALPMRVLARDTRRVLVANPAVREP